jgi:septum formation protein
MILPPHIRLILASQSPRRSQLLEMAGIPFVVKPMPIDEIWPDTLPAAEVAPYLAQQKAQAASVLLESPNDVLLTADSVVILDDVIYGKPADYDEGFQILSNLSGRTHQVITGVCLRSHNREVVFADLAEVHFDPLSTEEIDYYLKRYQPYDKAGAYAIQEWIGLCKISKIEGSYANIMGLPVQRLYKELKKFVTG